MAEVSQKEEYVKDKSEKEIESIEIKEKGDACFKTSEEEYTDSFEVDDADIQEEKDLENESEEFLETVNDNDKDLEQDMIPKIMQVHTNTQNTNLFLDATIKPLI